MALTLLCSGTISIFFDKALLVLVICGKINSKLLLPVLHIGGLCIFLFSLKKSNYQNTGIPRLVRFFGPQVTALLEKLH
jgi:hypothetical protein